jgi:hypothetical protein
MHGLGRRGVAELVRDVEPPVPLALRVRLRVRLNDERRRLDVALLVEDPQVELQVRPVGRQRVDHALEVVGEPHGAKRSACLESRA